MQATQRALLVDAAYDTAIHAIRTVFRVQDGLVWPDEPVYDVSYVRAQMMELYQVRCPYGVANVARHQTLIEHTAREATSHRTLSSSICKRTCWTWRTRISTRAGWRGSPSGSAKVPRRVASITLCDTPALMPRNGCSRAVLVSHAQAPTRATCFRRRPSTKLDGGWACTSTRCGRICTRYAPGRPRPPSGIGPRALTHRRGRFTGWPAGSPGATGRRDDSVRGVGVQGVPAPRVRILRAAVRAAAGALPTTARQRANAPQSGRSSPGLARPADAFPNGYRLVRLTCTAAVGAAAVATRYDRRRCARGSRVPWPNEWPASRRPFPIFVREHLHFYLPLNYDEHVAEFYRSPKP